MLVTPHFLIWVTGASLAFPWAEQGNCSFSECGERDLPAPGGSGALGKSALLLS